MKWNIWSAFFCGALEWGDRNVQYDILTLKFWTLQLAIERPVLRKAKRKKMYSFLNDWNYTITLIGVNHLVTIPFTSQPTIFYDSAGSYGSPYGSYHVFSVLAPGSNTHDDFRLRTAICKCNLKTHFEMNWSLNMSRNSLPKPVVKQHMIARWRWFLKNRLYKCISPRVCQENFFNLSVLIKISF